MHEPAGTNSRTKCCRASRAGFTLIEVLIAVLLLDIGLLALAGACAVLIRHTALARSRATALQLATNRLETLASGECMAASGVVVGAWGFRESWSVRLVPIGAREIGDSVSFTVQGISRSIVLRTRLPC